MTLPPRRGDGLRRGRLGELLAVGAAGLCAAFAATWTQSASGQAVVTSATYADPTGDSAAPDVGAVTVSTDDTGLITFSIAATAFPSAGLPSGGYSTVDVWLNTDESIVTGDDYGFEYVLRAARPASGPQAAYLFKWTGSQFTRVASAPSVAASGTGDTVSLTVAPADLGGATSFDFRVLTANNDAGGNASQFDFAPDHATWRYPQAAVPTTSTETDTGATTTVAVTTTPPPPPAPGPLVIGGPATEPALPRPGEAFVAGFTVSEDGTVPAGLRATARVTLAGRALGSRLRLVHGNAVVTVHVPAAAARKQLVVAVRAHAGGKSASRSVSFRVAAR